MQEDQGLLTHPRASDNELEELLDFVAGHVVVDTEGQDICSVLNDDRDAVSFRNTHYCVAMAIRKQM